MNLRGGGDAVRPVHRAADFWGLGARAPSTQSGAQHPPPANSAPAAPPLAALKGLRGDLAAPGHGAGEPRGASGDGGEEDEDWDEDEDSAGEIGGGAIGNLLYKAPPPALPPLLFSRPCPRPYCALPYRPTLSCTLSRSPPALPFTLSRSLLHPPYHSPYRDFCCSVKAPAGPAPARLPPDAAAAAA
jgi:hypothetical protein